MNDPVIDLSHWNAEPNWSLLKQNGTVGVILKATQGTGYVDPTYGARATKAKEAGLLISSYHFMEGGNVQKQMDWYLSRVGPSVGDRLCLDFEQNPNGKSATLSELEEAAEYLLSKGDFNVAVYGSSYLTEAIGTKKSSILSKTSLWQARYSSSPPKVPTSVWPRWDLWQYTQEGVPVGAVGNTDCNKWNSEAGDVTLWFHFDTGVEPETPDIDDLSIVAVSLVVSPPEGVDVNLHIDVTAPPASGVYVTVNGQVVADVDPVA